MKPFFSMVAIIILLAGCSASPDYPSKSKYYSSGAQKTSHMSFDTAPPAPLPTYNKQAAEVCVGQWCRCEVD